VSKWSLAFVYVGCVFMANWFVGNVGHQYTPVGPHVIPVGFGLEAPSGVLWVGVALVARDLVQQYFGRPFAVGAMLVGAVLSYFVAPSLALASACGFLLSETADLMVYTPLVRRGLLVVAVFMSSTVGLLVDTFVFLWLAFGGLDFWQGQVVGKLWASGLATIGIWIIRKRIPRVAAASGAGFRLRRRSPALSDE
jgi:queuosine precursor transporter